MTNRNWVVGRFLVRGACFLTAAWLSGCVTQDADLENGAIMHFHMEPGATSVAVYAVDVNVAAGVNYLSTEPVTLEIMVEGEVVHEETFDVSEEAEIALSVNVPLSRMGTNEIVGTLSYNGQSATRRKTVTVDEDAATVKFPSWSTNHDQSQTVEVMPAAGWSATQLEYSVNGGTWMDADPGDSGKFMVDLVRLDIGNNEFAVRAHTQDAGHERVDSFVDTIENIAPVFDCDTPASSMLPSTDLHRTLQEDARTMVGYFGDPQRDHDIHFVIDYRNDPANQDISASAVISHRSWESVTAVFNTRAANCNIPFNNNNCSQNYGLSLYVDGQLICQNTNFGTVNDQ